MKNMKIVNENDEKQIRDTITAQEEYMKSGLLPMSDATGDPFKKERNLTLPTDKGDLKKLQVKVDLTKIGQAPRAFEIILKEAED